MEEGGAEPEPCGAYMLAWMAWKESLVLGYRHMVAGGCVCVCRGRCQASHQQMDEPRRRMCAMRQTHQQLAGA